MFLGKNNSFKDCSFNLKHFYQNIFQGELGEWNSKKA